MVSEVDNVIDTLERERDELLAQAKQRETVIAGLRALHSGVVIMRDGANLPTSRDYAGMGILEAARAFVKEAGRPLTTRELTDGLLAKGWSTKSRNITATVYATLKNSKTEWKRNAAGEWEYFGAR